MLFSSRSIEAVADFLAEHPVQLVVEPVMVASSCARLLEEDAVETLVARLFPLATVITPNLIEARALLPSNTVLLGRSELAERLHALGAAAVIVTGGDGEGSAGHLFDGERHASISGERPQTRA